MNIPLDDDDRRAVDFLLNGESLISSEAPMFVEPLHTGMLGRVASTEKLLSALDHFVVEDSALDLADKTLQRIDGAINNAFTSEPALHAPTDDGAVDPSAS